MWVICYHYFAVLSQIWPLFSISSCFFNSPNFQWLSLKCELWVSIFSHELTCFMHSGNTFCCIWISSIAWLFLAWDTISFAPKFHCQNPRAYKVWTCMSPPPLFKWGMWVRRTFFKAIGLHVPVYFFFMFWSLLLIRGKNDSWQEYLMPVCKRFPSFSREAP